MDFIFYLLFILSLLGWFGIIIILLSKKASFLKKFANIIIEGTRKSGAKNKNNIVWQIPTKYSQISDKDLDDVASKIINVLALLAGIYGILFALIISDKASLVFISWSFSIWCGWVLAILVRIGHWCTILTNDYYQWGRKKKEEVLHGISIFTKHCIYILVFTASYVPIFAIMKIINNKEILEIYPWKQEASLFYGILSIIWCTFIIYQVFLGIEYLYEPFDISLYMIITLWLIGLSLVYSSPLTPRSFLYIAYFYDYPVPSVFKSIEISFTWAGLIMTMPMLKVIIRFFYQVSQKIIAGLKYILHMG